MYISHKRYMKRNEEVPCNTLRLPREGVGGRESVGGIRYGFWRNKKMRRGGTGAQAVRFWEGDPRNAFLPPQGQSALKHSIMR